MFDLQISCIAIICFLFVSFLLKGKFQKGTQKLYIVLLVVSALEILFEILAVLAIQQIGTMSPVVFKTIHRSYLTLVLTVFYLNFRYKSAFVLEEIGMPDKGIAFIHVAQVILYAGIFLLPIGYEITESGAKFSYGPGVWVAYVGAAFYLFVIFSNYCEQIRRIPKEQILPLVIGVGCGMVTCFMYMSNPKLNVSALGIVIVNIAMYISMQATEYYHKKEKENESVSETAETTTVSRISFEAPEARVLIVDDSEMNRRVLRNLLQKTKMQIDEVPGGKECLELVRKNTYHLIFMDHMMPEMDGLETFEVLKNEHLCDTTPVIAMTANTMTMTEEDYLKLGFAAFSTKPILPEKLHVLVYQHLDKRLVTAVEKTEEVVEETKVKVQPMEEIGDVQDNWENLPTVDGLDYNYAALHFQSTSEFEEMIRFLVQVMSQDMEELKGYYAALDTEPNMHNYQTKVHSMKNSAMTVGIVPLAGLTKTLEEAAKDQNSKQISALMPIFEEKWEKYRVLLLINFEPDHSEKVQADPASEEISELFRKLRDAAEEMDIDALDRIMEQIEGYSFPQEYEEKLQQIRLAVMNFDVDYLREEGYL